MTVDVIVMQYGTVVVTHRDEPLHRLPALVEHAALAYPDPVIEVYPKPDVQR